VSPPVAGAPELNNGTEVIFSFILLDGPFIILPDILPDIQDGILLLFACEGLLIGRMMRK